MSSFTMDDAKKAAAARGQIVVKVGGNPLKEHWLAKPWKHNGEDFYVCGIDGILKILYLKPIDDSIQPYLCTTNPRSAGHD